MNLKCEIYSWESSVVFQHLIDYTSIDNGAIPVVCLHADNGEVHVVYHHP